MTKFSIGAFTNGIYTISGFMFKGLLYGMITQTNCPKFLKIFSFKKTSEFYLNDNIPHFKRKNNFLTRCCLFVTGKLSDSRTYCIIDFLKEICDLPLCALQYKCFIDSEKRAVLIEKHTEKNKILNYVNLNEGLEFFLVWIMTQKYKSMKIVNSSSLVERTKFGVVENRDYLFDDNCDVYIPTFHNKKIYLELNTYSILDTVYQTYIDRIYATTGLQKEFENISNKIKQ